jgi:hypothetical protein
VRNAAIAVLAGAGAAALYSVLSPEETPERDLLRSRRNRQADPRARAEASAMHVPKDHVLSLDDARGQTKIDADGGPLVLWIELPAGYRYQIRRTEGTARVLLVAERDEAGGHWFGFEFRKDGDAKLTVTRAGRYVTHFHVWARNVGRGIG